MRWDQIWFFGLGTLLLSMVVCTKLASAAVTNNLLPNANSGVDWNSSSTDMINSGGSGVVYNGNTINGFTVTCPTQQSNCGYKYDIGGDFEVTGTATLSANNIKLYDNTITQSMLDNGITLNSTIDVANCESNLGNCESRGGNNDSHTVTITLRDNDNNILSNVTQTRTEISGFQGNCNGYPGTNSTSVTANCGQYTDTMIYTDVGANNLDWSWTGIDNNYVNQSKQGPNLLGATLSMTYEEFTIDLDIDEVSNFDTIEENLDLDVDEWLDVFTDLYIKDDDVFVFAPLEVPDMPFLEYDLGFDEYMWEDEITIDNDTDLELIDEDPIFFLGDASEVEGDSEDEFFESAADMSLFFAEYEEDLPEEESDTQIEASNLGPSLENEENDENSVEIQDDLEFVESTKPSEALGEAKEGVEVVEVTSEISPTVEIREVVVVSIDDYLTDNLNKIDEMVAAQGIIQEQNIYIDQAIYTNQVFYVDNRVLAQNISLNINDPLEEYQLKILNNRKKQNELKRKLNELKWN